MRFEYYTSRYAPPPGAEERREAAKRAYLKLDLQERKELETVAAHALADERGRLPRNLGSWTQAEILAAVGQLINRHLGDPEGVAHNPDADVVGLEFEDGAQPDDW